MNEEDVLKLIVSRYLNEFNGQFPIAIPNIEFTEPQRGTWVNLRVNLNQGFQETSGRRTNRKFNGIGMILIDVSTDRNRGINENSRICRLSRDLFDGEHLQSSWYYNGSIRTIGNIDQFFRQRVTVEFQYEYFK